jgi:tRNA A-37 threonylcarbamoyl transferase component Bud32
MDARLPQRHASPGQVRMLNSPDSELLACAARKLPGAELIPSGDLPSHLARLQGPGRLTYIAKLHRSPERFRAEHHAYRQWTAVLGTHAPKLITADTAHHILILTALPGVPATVLTGTPEEPAAHRDAGRRLRALHQARAPRPDPHIAGVLAERLRHWVQRAHGLVRLQDRAVLLRHADALTNAGPLNVSVCHLDFQPRNWLVDRGTVSLVDFEHCRIDAQVRDLTRLAHRHWQGRADLREAFLAGYGRPLTPAEVSLLRHFGAIDAVTSIVQAHEADHPELDAYGRRLLSQIA